MSTENLHVNRVPEGVPTGGQFAASSRGEAGVTLAGTGSDDGAMTADVETFDMLWCEACEEAFEESDAARLYECENCQTKSTERRCETCKKFMARSEEPGCPRCEEPVPEDTVQVVHDHDGEIIRLEDYEPDGPTKAERDAEKKAADAAKAEADRVARLAAKKANTAEGTAAAVEPGAVLINPDDDSRFATEAEVLSVRHVETPDGPIVIFKAYDYSPKTIVRRASDPVAVQAKVERFPTEKGNRDGSRITAADFGHIRVADGFQERMRSVSSPSNGIDVQVGTSARDGGTLPALALLVGRRAPSGSMSGMTHYLGRWDDPDVAAKALDDLERAADIFEAARTEHPPVAVDDEDDSYDKRQRPADWTPVRVSEPDWIGADEMATVDVEIGLSDWDPDLGALLKASGGGQNMTIDNPETLRTAVAEARKHLHTLTGIPTRADVVDDKI